MYRSGTVSLEYLSGSKSKPCDNCGDRHATMYRLAIAKDREVGAPPNLEWVLCCRCNGNIARVYERRERDYRDCY